MNNPQFLSRCSADAIKLAARSLMDGNLVAFPTETVYGLGADATNADAVSRIYIVKGRPTEHPLIVHVPSMQAIEPWVSELPSFAISLARDFWPGPMTLILERSSLAKDFITGAQESVGIRVPNHPIALSLLQEFHNLGGKGVAAPSANRFGHVSPTTAEAVQSELNAYLEESDLVLDGGQSSVGLESTIIDCSQDSPRILRPGAISAEMIRTSTGLEVFEFHNISKIKVSGALEKHYSPIAQVILDQLPERGQGYIALGTFPTPEGVIRLADPSSNEEFARDLYHALRKADELGLVSLVVQQPLGSGIAIAIRDRLLRASKGR
jgi:L-threonylcarbamoyladenylate synthase